MPTLPTVAPGPCAYVLQQLCAAIPVPLADVNLEGPSGVEGDDDNPLESDYNLIHDAARQAGTTPGGEAVAGEIVG